MQSRGLLALATVAALVLYAAVAVWPYEFQAPRLVANGAAPLPGGGVGFGSPGIALAKDAPVWLEPALSSNRLELALRIRSLAPDQSGPARILTFSDDPDHSDLLIGQEGADLVLRLRTPWTGQTGENEPLARLPELLRAREWVDLRVIVAPDRLRILRGAEVVLERPLPPLPLANWYPWHRLALGNEVTYNRPWRGEIRRAVVSSGGRSVDYADASQLAFPPEFPMLGSYPKLVPLRHLDVADAGRNVVFYVPLGLLLGLLFGARSGAPPWRVLLGALLGAALVSLGMELLQINVPRRVPSIDDVIFNTLGGGFGALLALGSERLLPAGSLRDPPSAGQRPSPAELINRIRR
jgi:hypothetical protein